MIVLFLFFSAQLRAQEDDPSFQPNYIEAWLDYTVTKPLNDKWSVGGDVGYRTPFSNSTFRTFYLRPFANYKLNDQYNFKGGIASFNTFRRNVNQFEFRIYQDAYIKWPTLGIFNFTHRFRFEERFFFFSNSSVSNEISVRGRYLLSVRTDPFSMGGEKRWTFYTSLEPFVRFTGVEEFQANNFRWDTALSYKVNEQWRVELHYILQNSEIFKRSDINENIFRLRVYHKLL